VDFSFTAWVQCQLSETTTIGLCKSFESWEDSLCSWCVTNSLSLLQASTKIELETDAVKKLKVTSEDFMAALQDIKPVNIPSYILLYSLNSFNTIG